ncbi:hypothetical protein [Dongia sp.]|uniref:hypothetical protein n=1 Tax=Dongia sp. TaxID=1977262 RepID=UPI0034A5D27F
MPVDLALAAVLIGAPLVRHFLEEGRVHDAVELVHVHRVDAILKSPIFGLMAFDRFLVLVPLVRVARV